MTRNILLRVLSFEVPEQEANDGPFRLAASTIRPISAAMGGLLSSFERVPVSQTNISAQIAEAGRGYSMTKRRGHNDQKYFVEVLMTGGILLP